MFRRAVYGIMLILLLSGMLLAFNIQQSRASGTIYIRADGSIDGPANITTVDYVTYTFNESNYDEIVVERDNIIIDGDGYTLQGTGTGSGIDLSYRSNVTIKNMEIRDFSYGIDFQSSNYNSISGNHITNNYLGIWLRSSSNNNISGNNITTNNDDGISFADSSNNNISGNNITTNNDLGILFADSSNNNISGNSITNNYNGIWLRSSSNITIFGNNITTNSGTNILFSYSSNNSISRNNIANSYLGIWLDDSHHSVFYHNNFDSNTLQISIYYIAVNIWDRGYPSGGNYWSDYNGVDLFSGRYQNVTGSDGIGDTPYVIDADNQDQYPFMHPLVPDVAITSVEPSRTVVGQGYSLNMNVTAENQGDYTETFNVTVYANTTIIETKEVTLSSGNSTIILFAWNTTGFAKGNYTIEAVADIIPGEIETTDNNFTDGWVIIAMVGDITGPHDWPDGECEMRDIGLVARHFGEDVPPAPANCDLTGLITGVPDGIIDMRDVGLVARHFGETDP